MIGAGVFAIGPAARRRHGSVGPGSGSRRSLPSTATPPPLQLAAIYPQSGNLRPGRERLGPFWGYIAGGDSSSARRPAVPRWRSPSLRLARLATPDRRRSGRRAHRCQLPGCAEDGVAHPRHRRDHPRRPCHRRHRCGRRFGDDHRQPRQDHQGRWLDRDLAVRRACCSSRSPGTPASPHSAKKSSTPSAPFPVRSRSRSGSPSSSTRSSPSPHSSPPDPTRSPRRTPTRHRRYSR